MNGGLCVACACVPTARVLVRSPSRSPAHSVAEQVVAKFLQNTTAIPQAADFNASGRGYPDVAALAYVAVVVVVLCPPGSSKGMCPCVTGVL
jgi:hypothetical protein